jgi:hypothetical protein
MPARPGSDGQREPQIVPLPHPGVDADAFGSQVNRTALPPSGLSSAWG